MKRNYMLCFAGLLSLLLGGCAGAQSQMRFLGIEEAKRLATEEAGFSPEKVEFTETALNSRNGIDYYQIEFKAENEAYEYDIDALTGVVIDSSVPAAGAALDSKDSGAGGKDSAGMKMLTEEEAKEKALAHAGLTNEQAAFVKCKADHDDGVQIYNVEFYFEDKEYDYDIDAYTGEVIRFDYDAESYAASESGAMITAETAKELALSQVPGAALNDIFEFETDYDDGHTEYEGKIIYNGMEYEFSIDAYSGAFRSWETEPIDD